MELVKSLKKKENKRRSLTKLKLDLKKDNLTNIEKIVKFMANDLKDLDLKCLSPKEYLKFNNFKIDVEKVVNFDIKDRVSKSYSNEDVDVYEIKVEDYMGRSLKAYTIPSSKIPNKNRKYNYSIPTTSDRKKILDINYIYGVLKTIDIVIDEINEKEEFYLSTEFKNISLFKNMYEYVDVSYLYELVVNTNFSLYCLLGMNSKLYKKVLSLIIDVAAVMQNLDLNIELNEKYDKNTNSECARAFETKKNIPEKILKVMDNNKFLNDFSYVEIDEGTDIHKFHIIENEWNKLKVDLNLDTFLKDAKPELRFKKLGKHRALGLYYPGLKCICVDITSPSSFLHEFAHFIDYTFAGKQLSLQMDFYQLIGEYQKAYNQYLDINDNLPNKEYLNKKRKYFFTPTEIFARCFELYLINKGVKTSFLKEKNELRIEGGYPEIDETFNNLITSYFNNICDINFELLKNNSTIKKMNIVNKEYIEPVASRTGQLIFSI